MVKKTSKVRFVRRSAIQRAGLLAMLALFVASSWVPTVSALALDNAQKSDAAISSAKQPAPLQSAAVAATSANGQTPDVSADLAASKPDLNTLNPGENIRAEAKQTSDFSTELSNKRTANSRTYKATDGSNVTKFYATDVNYKDGSAYKQLGNAVDEDTQYEQANKVPENWLDRILPGSPQPKGFKADSGPLSVAFQTLTNGDGIKVTSNTDTVSLRPISTNDGIKPDVTKGKDGQADTITYKNVWDGVDLQYEYHGNNVKEYIVVHKKRRAVEVRLYR